MKEEVIRGEIAVPTRIHGLKIIVQMHMGAEILAEVPRDRPDGHEFDVCKVLLISGVATWRVGSRFRLAPAEAVAQVFGIMYVHDA
ncbi:uncharacterized protein EAE98_005136 [Botrytis deweyae]|uniref:Uncharacterized protein n=1 Tax=Botrytis deweyae TaxID=2478750 RepID=A0ABQ7IN04_9HELO|nr:uncharacterized protein EAE98_005136 [Botrytis deweyae]KAF7929217.1 hypothetical protein EAE98_005136 [Botrytis deweyae]